MNSFLRIQSRHRAPVVASVLLALMPCAIAQTLYVPGGTGGIGTSANGNVGIGTTSPYQKLHVNGGAVRADLGGGGASAIFTGGGSNFHVMHDSSADVRFMNSSGGGYRWTNFTNTQDFVVISGTGNVGIGTTSPGAKLDVVGPTRLTDAAGERDSWFPYSNNWSYVTGDGIIFRRGYDAGYAERMRIDSSGNVGIGTASPSQRLHVEGSVLTNGGKMTAGNGTNNGNNSGIWFWSDTDSNHVIYSANSASGIRPGGSVAGDAPDNRLGGAGEHRLRFRTATGQGWLFENNGNVGVIDFDSDDGSAYFAGNVGIGTTNPTQKLSVNGTVRAKEVIVEASPWPDDVFAAGYALPTLGDIETHIAAHGHLPGVPSAATVAEEGIALSEMQRTMMRKIEELTLYVIEQQKQIAELRQENAAIRAQLTPAVAVPTP